MGQPRWTVWMAGVALLLAWGGLHVQADELDDPVTPDAEATAPAMDEPAPEGAPEDAADGAEAGREPHDRPDRPDPRSGRRTAARSESQVNQKLRMLESFRDQIIREMKLEGELVEEVNLIFADHLDYLRERSTDNTDDRRERAEEIREVVEEMRAARQDGDVEEVRRLRDRLVELRRSSTEFDLEHEELFDMLREAFDDEQIVVFDRLAEQFELRLQGPNRRDTAASRMRRALAKLELSPEQRMQTRRLLAEYGREMRTARGDAERLRAMEDELYNALLDELDEGQAERFERTMEELAAQGKQPHRGPRGPREAGGSADAPAPADDPEAEAAYDDEVGEYDEGGEVPE